MVGLLYLKHAFGESDRKCRPWAERLPTGREKSLFKKLVPRMVRRASCE